MGNMQKKHEKIKNVLEMVQLKLNEKNIDSDTKNERNSHFSLYIILLLNFHMNGFIHIVTMCKYYKL